MKIKYQCEICGKFYNTEKAANYCESKHEPYFICDCQYKEGEFTVPTVACVSTPAGVYKYDLRDEYMSKEAKERDEKIKEALEELESVT